MAAFRTPLALFSCTMLLFFAVSPCLGEWQLVTVATIDVSGKGELEFYTSSKKLSSTSFKIVWDDIGVRYGRNTVKAHEGEVRPLLITSLP